MENFDGVRYYELVNRKVKLILSKQLHEWLKPNIRRNVV